MAVPHCCMDTTTQGNYKADFLRESHILVAWQRVGRPGFRSLNQ